MNYIHHCPNCLIDTETHEEMPPIHTDNERVEQNTIAFKLLLLARIKYVQELHNHGRNVAKARKDADTFNQKFWNRFLGRARTITNIFDTIEVFCHSTIDHSLIGSYTPPPTPRCIKINYKYIECPVCKHWKYIENKP